jgi:4-hydroxy-3-polyprenylbenzoate decarboxylase
LGKSQLSLAKYLLISNKEDDPSLKTSNIEGFIKHILERVDLSRDLHFYTRTTIDTLDYSGTDINSGSKVAIAAAGDKKRILWTELPSSFTMPRTFDKFKMVMPGVLAVEAPPFTSHEQTTQEIEILNSALADSNLDGLPLFILCDDAGFVAANINNFVWVSFTRSNPSHDIYGINSFTEHKHWGCMGPLIIDARLKKHHAPQLIKDPEVEKRVDQLGAKGGVLHGII